MTEKMIIHAYCRIRTIDNTIPDDVLDFMKDAAIEKLRKHAVSSSIEVEDALAFAEYFRNNFDYYDCNANGRVYKWIDLQKRDKAAMTMKQIFDYWQSHSN